ncbi:hypothetical protein KDA06_02735 [Candidatus Saccharibacteria bacterium]|nr:hypothetical protein [Candidatus Saccharibacteria bacterium]HPR09590.1 hypothetical protein [Candidatus Saccharibacteria bacterium]
MDFRQTSQVPHNRVEPATQVTHSGAKATKSRAQSRDWLSYLKGLLLLCVSLLVLASLFALLRGGSTVNESSNVNTSKYQAVFLNNGQVYFGKAKEVNGRFITLDDVYYLTQNTGSTANGQTTTTGDYTLVKLGCQQIHYPEDRMVISRDQVTFWENLNADGKVAKSIADFKAKYPKGPDCTEQTSQTPAQNTPSQATTQQTTQTQTNTTTPTTTR